MRTAGTTRFALLAYAAALVVLVAAPWGHALNRLTVRLYMFFRYTWPVAPDWALPEHYGLVLNVLLFVPLGVVLTLLTRWGWWRVTLVAAVTSAAFETIQLVLPRDPELFDVLTNSLGAALGALAVSAFVGRRARPAR